jgi:hypothetical protein
MISIFSDRATQQQVLVWKLHKRQQLRCRGEKVIIKKGPLIYVKYNIFSASVGHWLYPNTLYGPIACPYRVGVNDCHCIARIYATSS